MAETIKQQGIINPIEIDEKNIIVTGAMRFRAAKLAGLKEIPCRIVTGLSDNDRYLRQVIENLQREDLLEYENYEVVKNLRKMFPKKTKVELGKMIGKGSAFIDDYETVIFAKTPIKTAFLLGKLEISKARELDKTPQKYQRALIKKVITEKIPQRAIVAINKKLTEVSQSAPKILKENFTGMHETIISDHLTRLAPGTLELPSVALRALKMKVEGLQNFLKANPNIIFRDSPAYARQIVKIMDALRNDIDDYIGIAPKKIKSHEQT